jgi:hypothetical protein
MKRRRKKKKEEKEEKEIYVRNCKGINPKCKMKNEK